MLFASALLIVALLWLIVVWNKSRDMPQMRNEVQPPPAATPASERIHAPRPLPSMSLAMLTLKANAAWLDGKWDQAEKDRVSGATKKYPKWYFDPVTERQLARLESDGFSLGTVPLSKGRASDLIGLLQPPKDVDPDLLEFFKVDPYFRNETRAKAEADRLLADPANVEALLARPADPIQREQLRFYGVKIPTRLSQGQASELLERREVELVAQNSPLLAEVETYIFIFAEILNGSACTEFDVKKPSLTAIRAAVKDLREEGRSLDDLSDNLYLVLERIEDNRV